MIILEKIVSAALLMCLLFSGYAHSSDYDKLTVQEKADLARFLGWVWGDGRPGYQGTGILYKGGNPNYNATVKRLAQIRFDGRTNPFGFPVSGNLKLTHVWEYWNNSLPGGNPGDPDVLRDAIRHPNFLAGLLEGEGQIFHSNPSANFYVADQSYSPSHPDKLYDIANFGTERMVQLLRLLAETYGFSNPTISIANRRYAYNTQLCEAIEHLRDEYDRRRASNERGDLVSGFSVKVFINPANFDEIRDYGYFEKLDGKYRTPAPDSLLRIIRNSLPDQNIEATGPTAFFDNGSQSDPCSTDDSTGGSDRFVGEFTSFGNSAGTGRFQTFEVPVIAGEETLLRLEWLQPLAQLRVFVRDPNDNFVVSDTSAAGSPKFVVVPAGVGGIYTVAVMVAEGRTAYTLKVNPFEDSPQPSLVDYEFISSG